MNEIFRSEKEIFKELEVLCKSAGYVHAIAYFCFRDNTIRYAGEISVDDVLQQFSMERLIRTEISTLIGLACKGNLEASHPVPEKLQEYMDKTGSLLQELHRSMIPSFEVIFNQSKMADPSFNPFMNGEVLRESIFYGGEAAYNFQYKDLSILKYKNDNDWFIENKGYSIEQAGSLISSLRQMQNDQFNNMVPAFFEKHPNEWTLLPFFTFSIEELAVKSGETAETAKNFIDSFVVPDNIDKNIFSAIDDFNPLNAYPIINLGHDYLLFQHYSLVEALYETPFFWFNDDESYKDKAIENRGYFTESFSEERLKIVFGEKRVFTNIDIYKDKKTRVGEIDVLVVFSNRAIVLQAKSKKLTIAARKGNDNCLRNDFKKAVQHAYDQAYMCSEFLKDEKYRLISTDGNELSINRNIREIYPFCVISDHYPALSFQARQFLTYQTIEEIKPPFVMDVFLLDVMTEMLQSPLYFLSYINRRVEYAERILSNHELTILSYHLKRNLWIDSDISMLQLEDDICADLDLAMLTRRDGAPGRDTPDGILTRYKDTTYGRLINEIESFEDPATIDLGFMLLSLSGDTIEQINDGIDQLCYRYLKDSRHHDLTLGIGKGKTGLTIHCNNDHPHIAIRNLQEHCNRRKYKSKANSWFGLFINPINKSIKFGFELNFDWEQSDEMDEITKDLPTVHNLKNGRRINSNTKEKHRIKIGRNEQCPCGSGKKYKKCCIDQSR